MLTVLGGNSASTTGYNLTRSLRFRSSASAYLSRTPASAGNPQKFTYSAWIKLGNTNASRRLIGTYVTDVGESVIYFENQSLTVFEFTNLSGVKALLATQQVFRDPSAWYHIVVAVDTTQATSTNRIKVYVNGLQVTAFQTAIYPAQNTNFSVFNSQNLTGIAATPFPWGPDYCFDGYIAEHYWIDGQALTPSSFGSYNSVSGVWQPARYAGTYGTNGFYLPFTDNSALTTASNVGLGKDFSGNGNYWATNNISITSGVTYDSMTDVPTLTSATVANFAVLNGNVNRQYGGTGFGTYSDGNLKATWTSGGETFQAFASIEITQSMPKIYWEVKNLVLGDSGNYPLSGIANANQTSSSTNTSWFITAGGGVGVYANGTVYQNAPLTSVTAPGATGVIGYAYDPATGKFWIAINGTWQNSGNPVTGVNPAATLPTTNNWIPVLGNYGGSPQSSSAINFGQQPFTYTPPTGFVALNTFNLPTSTIVKGNTVMDATLYTGNGSTQTITNSSGFKPDLVWVKSRSATTDNKWTDSVRGVTKAIVSNTTAAGTTDINGLTAFNSNGWSLGSDTTYNNNSATYVGWQWQAGQGATSNNTAGSITSTVSVNATAGFSIGYFTSTGTVSTVGHGLGVAPKFIIARANLNTSNWIVYHGSISPTKTAFLNGNLVGVQPNIWNNTAPSSSVVTLGTAVPGSQTVIAYMWAAIPGYSSFGSYTGNGSADGPFVYCGFKPRFILFKDASGVSFGEFYVYDTARSTFNTLSSALLPAFANAEISVSAVDVLSNGFKIRSTNVNVNRNSTLYIYSAFASNPFKNSLAV